MATITEPKPLDRSYDFLRKILLDQLQTSADVRAGVIPPFDLQVARGLVPGFQRVSIFGHNPDVDSNSLPEDIWEPGGLFPFQTSAVALEAVSDSDSDTNADGTGARSLTVSGLDANWEPISDTVNLTGQTPVALNKSFFRVNRAFVTSAGSGLQNAGNITVRRPGPGNVQAFIEAGDGRAMQAVYSVAAGHSLAVMYREASITKEVTAVAEIEIRTRATGSGATAPWIVRMVFGVSATGSSHVVSPPLFAFVPEKTDIRMTVTASSLQNLSISGTIEAWLIAN